jgi:hypothetical protein
METILVTVPAYEDPLLIDTVSSIFKKADNPDRVFVIIGLQYYQIPYQIYNIHKNVESIVFDVNNRPGINFIRKEMLAKFDHDYLLMIDSHSDFADSWDTKIVSDYKDLQSSTTHKAILSKPCSDLVGNLAEQDDLYDKEGVIWELRDAGSLWSDLYPFYGPRMDSEGLKFCWTGYTCCHFMFTNKDWVNQVGISDVTRSYCEEPLLSYMSYASGWDVYSMPSYNHVAHLDKKYNLSRYGTEYVDRKRKDFGLSDTEEVRAKVHNYILNGTGDEFPSPLPHRDPKNFFSDISLLGALPILKERFMV